MILKKVKKLIILNKMKMKKHILNLTDSNTFTPLVSSILFVVQTHCLFLFQCNGGRPILNWFSQHRWSFPRNLISKIKKCHLDRRKRHKSRIYCIDVFDFKRPNKSPCLAPLTPLEGVDPGGIWQPARILGPPQNRKILRMNSWTSSKKKDFEDKFLNNLKTERFWG